MIRIARPVALTAVLAVLVACGKPGFNHHTDAQQYLTPAVHAALPRQSGAYLGVYEPGVPRTYRMVDNFTSAIRRSPNLLLYYSSWGKPFETSFADKALAHGAVSVVQLDPGTTSLNAIADGRYDSYLRTYASQVRAFGHPVVIGFAREMNGWWYPWSSPRVSPGTWIAAWRHIVIVFRARGADNVTWQWTINNFVPGTGSPQMWWPGAAYVTWVGIDGYYYTARNSFADVFGPTITAVRKFSAEPIVISETAISPKADPARQMPALFAGIRDRHLLGLVWFDAPAHQDWRLENDPAALAAFRNAAATFKKQTSPATRTRSQHDPR